FARFMKEAFEEYSNYIEDTESQPGLPGFADFMREKRRDEKSESEKNDRLKAIFGAAGSQVIRVYFINSFDNVYKEKCYFFAAASAELHEQMVESLNERGRIPDFAVIVAKDYGKPTREVKDYMKYLFGFDHDSLAKPDHD